MVKRERKSANIGHNYYHIRNRDNHTQANKQAQETNCEHDGGGRRETLKFISGRQGDRQIGAIINKTGPLLVVIVVVVLIAYFSQQLSYKASKQTDNRTD